MKLKDLIVENEIRKRWRKEARQKYKEVVDKLKSGDFSTGNLPKSRDELFQYEGSGRDLYLDVNLDLITVRLLMTYKGTGEVEGFVEVKSEKRRFGVKHVDDVLIGLKVLPFTVLDGIYMEEDPINVLRKYIVSSFTDNDPPWPERDDVLRTFIHEYIEFKKLQSGEDNPKRKGSDYEKLSSDELDARFNETIGWIEDKINRGKLDRELEDFETFQEWYFDKFDDLFWELDQKTKKKLINKLYKWFEENR